MKLIKILICDLSQNCGVCVPLRYPVIDPITKNIHFEDIPVSNVSGLFDEDPLVVDKKLSLSCAAWLELKNFCLETDFGKYLDDTKYLIVNGRNRASKCGDDDVIPARIVGVTSICEATQIAIGTRVTRFHIYYSITK